MAPETSSAGMFAALGDRLIRVLPPAFLLLVLMNVIFLGSVVWFINHSAEQRNVLLTKIVEGCLLQNKESAK